MIRSLAIASIALGLASTAHAGTNITATLEAPKERLVKIAAAKALWKCEDTTCTATLNRSPVKLSTCKEVVRSIGKVSAFASDERALSDANLKKCNAVAES